MDHDEFMEKYRATLINTSTENEEIFKNLDKTWDKIVEHSRRNPFIIHVPINERREKVRVDHWVRQQLRRKRGRPHYQIPYDQHVAMCLGAKYPTAG